MRSTVDQLREEIRILRMAIDELRDDVVWAARQVLSAGYQVAPEQMPYQARDPLAPDADLDSGHNAADDLPESNLATAALTIAEDSAIEIPAGAPASAEAPAARAKQAPLYMRMYHQRVLTDVVRAIGYETVSGDEARRRLEPLIEKHGQKQVEGATGEMLELAPGRYDLWCLTFEARRAARALLGPPPPEPSRGIPAPAVNPLVDDLSAHASDAPSDQAALVKASRKIVLARFREHLDDAEEVTADVPEDIQKLLADRGRMIPDLILGEEPPYELLTVRRQLSATQRHDMHEWLEVSDFGNQATRVWPHEGPGGWEWEYEVVATKQLRTMREN